MQIYKVGGAVRDHLLGRPVSDVDWVVVGSTPEELLELGYRRVGRDFPVFLHPETREEYALARTERKAGRGYKGFEVDTSSEVSLEDDLRRRDLTINAMALDENDELIDPFKGRADLEAGLLRHVSPAFVEDPLRVLRVARFAARLEFRVAEETSALMREIVAGGELEDLTPERVWTEMARALGERNPVRFLETLRECGALASVLPEVDRLFGVPQRADYHPEIDTGAHVLMVLEQAAKLSPDVRVRFAALVHDLGKGTTPSDQWPSHRGHEERSVPLIEQLCRRLKIPGDFLDLAVLVALHHGKVHRIRELRPSSVLGLLGKLDALRRSERFDMFLLACEADARGRGGFQDQTYFQAEILNRLRDAAASIDPKPLADRGLSGPQMGERLRSLRLDAIKAAMGSD